MEVNFNKLKLNEIKIFNKIYIKEKYQFIKFLKDCYKKKNFYQFSPLLSRDDSTSFLYLQICNYKLVDFILDKHRDKKITIISSNYFQYLFLKKNIENKKIKIIFDFNLLKYILFFLKVIYRIIFLLIFSLIEIANKSKKRLFKYMNYKNIILVDTAFIKSMFKNDNFRERFYGNLSDFSDPNNQIVFSPVNLMFDKTKYSTRIIKKKKIDTIFRFDVLEISDYFFAFKKSILNFNPLNKKKYGSLDISILLFQDKINNIANFNFFYGILNYFFFKRLKKYKLNIKSIIHWSENQSADKGFVLGAKTFFKNSKLKSYIGYFSNYNATFNKQPTIDEYNSNLYTKEIYIQNLCLKSGLKKFCKKLKIQVAPNFRFQNVFKIKKVKIGNKKTNNILILLPVLKSEGINILNQVLNIKNNKELNNYKFIIKFHPNYGENFIRKYSKYINDKFKITNLEFNKIIKKADVVVSNQGSTLVESIMNGVPVVCACNLNYLMDNPLDGLVSKKLYFNSYNSDDLSNKLVKLNKMRKKKLFYKEFLKSKKKLLRNTGILNKKETLKFLNN